ncbi:tail fiber assembly protein [Xenorhabdus bovienii]|nr:tail fiber assembly protein [Xenorhabdus bovienii]
MNLPVFFGKKCQGLSCHNGAYGCSTSKRGDKNLRRLLVQCARVYRAGAQTREFIKSDMEYVLPGFSLSAGAYPDTPELPANDLAIRRTADGKMWEYVPDYRGKTAYHTETRQKTTVDYIGELKSVHTLLVPQTPSDSWAGTQWVTDTTALKSHHIRQAEHQKSSLQQQVDFVIKPLQDAVELDMATDTEKSALFAALPKRVVNLKTILLRSFQI